MARILTQEQRERFREYHREWERKTYAINPRKRIFTAEQKERRHQYYLKQRARQIAAINARRKANPLQRKQWEKTYYNRNRKALIAKGVERARRNPEKTRAKYARYHKRHPERAEPHWRKRIATGKIAEALHRRRARQRETQTEDCSKVVSLLRMLPLCHYCFGLFRSTPTIDHVIPLTRGGAHVRSNLVAACRPCNSSKGTKFLSEWNGRIEEAA